jgi:hypothetical protein
MGDEPGRFDGVQMVCYRRNLAVGSGIGEGRLRSATGLVQPPATDAGRRLPLFKTLDGAILPL